MALPSTETVVPSNHDESSSNALVSIKNNQQCKVDSIIVSNFKSYRGRHVIGPFQRLTGVIGPNGAGKSNLMDAISFVLGVQARHMRGSNLSDLIYRPSGGSDILHDYNENTNNNDDDELNSNTPQEANVMLNLRFISTGTLMTFCRKIIKGGLQSITQIDGKTISFEEYQKRLSEMNILVKARNFLVFQGDVTDVARKSPGDLGKLFEQISGSDMLKDEYEKYESEAKHIMSELKHETLNRQRFDAQKQDLEKQVSEMNEFRRLEQRLSDARRNLVVYRLYVNEVTAGQTQQQNEEAQEEAKKVEEKKNQQIKRIREVDAEATKESLEKKDITQSYEIAAKQIAELVGKNKSRRVDHKVASLKTAHMEVEIANISEKANFDKKHRADLQNKLDQQYVMEQNKKQRMQELKEEVMALESSIVELNKQVEIAKASEVKFTEKQKNEYQKLKQQAAVVTAGLQSTAMALENRHRGLEKTIEDLVGDMNEIQQQLNSSTEKLTYSDEYSKKCQNDLESLAHELHEKEAHLDKQQKELHTLINEEFNLSNERKQLEAELNKLNSGKKELDRLNKRREVVRELHEAFPGVVHGAMNELFEPSQKKYKVAINAALGRFADCVVVETFAIAKGAIDYLKRTKKPPLEFVSLDSLATNTSDPRISSLKNECRPALDCCAFDEKFEPAFRTALHDSIIVDSLSVAEKIAYHDAPRLNLKVKVITLDGEKVLKNGNLTIDTSLRNSSKLDTRELTRVSDRLHEIELVLRQRGQINQLQSSVSHLEKDVGELKDLIATKQEKLQMWGERKTAAEREVKRLQLLLKKQEKEKAIVGKELEKCREELKQVEARVLTAEDDIFAPLARQINIVDLRRFEEEQKTVGKEREQTKNQLMLRQKKLEMEMKRIESELDQIDLKLIEKQIKEAEKSKKKNCGLLEKMTQQRNELEKSIAKTKAQLDQLIENEKRIEIMLKKEREVLKQIQNEVAESNAKIQQLNARSETLYNEGTDLLKSTILDGIQLPLCRGTLRGYCKLLGLQEEMAVLLLSQETAQHGTDENIDVPMAITDGSSNDEEIPEIDYAKVLSTEALESCGSRESVKAIERGYEERVGEIRTDLSKRIPNLRAKEKYGGAVAEMKAVEKKIFNLEKEKDKNERIFLKIRRERNRRFLECFHHVQKAINRIYNRLTGGDETEDTIGGQAYLELESGSTTTAESFHSGILYHVIPPSKRFSDLKRLSGGEKTMAALALLFALQSYHPAPFFVLDEIDADLDPVNVLSLANYLREVKFQVIVISHADRVYSQADGLIGVFIDAVNESSDTLSVDLTSYPLASTHLDMNHPQSRQESRS